MRKSNKRISDQLFDAIIFEIRGLARKGKLPPRHGAMKINFSTPDGNAFDVRIRFDEKDVKEAWERHCKRFSKEKWSKEVSAKKTSLGYTDWSNEKESEAAMDLNGDKIRSLLRQEMDSLGVDRLACSSISSNCRVAMRSGKSMRMTASMNIDHVDTHLESKMRNRAYRTINHEKP